MLTVKEAAERLHVSPQTVYRWIEEGFLKVTRYPTGTVRIDPKEVQDLIERSSGDAQEIER